MGALPGNQVPSREHELREVCCSEGLGDWCLMHPIFCILGGESSRWEKEKYLGEYVKPD